MNISEAAKLSGLSTKTIRYYEDIGLVAPAQRGENGYRNYTQADINVFQFLQHAREVGFGLKECKHLLNLYQDPKRQSVEVKTLVLEKVREIDLKIKDLKAMKLTLKGLASQCAGDEQSDCAIIDGLSGQNRSSID